MDRLNYTQAAKIIFNHRNNRLRIKNLPPNCRPNNFEDAYKIHGYSEEFLSDKKTFAEIADGFLNFIKGKSLSHNNFSLSFISKFACPIYYFMK